MFVTSMFRESVFDHSPFVIWTFVRSNSRFWPATFTPPGLKLVGATGAPYKSPSPGQNVPLAHLSVALGLSTLRKPIKNRVKSRFSVGENLLKIQPRQRVKVISTLEFAGAWQTHFTLQSIFSSSNGDSEEKISLWKALFQNGVKACKRRWCNNLLAPSPPSGGAIKIVLKVWDRWNGTFLSYNEEALQEVARSRAQSVLLAGKNVSIYLRSLWWRRCAKIRLEVCGPQNYGAMRYLQGGWKVLLCVTINAVVAPE